MVITTLSTCANYITATDLYHYQTQHVGVDGLTTTITTTQTRFETVTISIDVSSVSRSDSLQESTSARFLHDGPSPTEREEHNGMAATTTTFQSLAGTGGTRIPTTVSTTSQNPAAPTGADGSRVPSLTTNTASQYLTAPTGTAAANDPETVNATSRYLTAPTRTVLPTSQEAANSTSPTGTQSDIGDDDVVIVTATVYPVKSIAPESSSINTVPVAPTAHDPVSAGMFPYRTGTATTQTIGIVANVSIPGATLPQVTSLAATAGFANDQTKPLERKDAKLRKHIAAPADSATATATRSLRTAAPSCREKGIFRLTVSPPFQPMQTYHPNVLQFDDIPRPADPANLTRTTSNPSLSSAPTTTSTSRRVSSSPPRPQDPYTPKSAPLLLEFVAQTPDATRNHKYPPGNEYGATGEISIGQNLQWGCYDFRALSVAVGCDSVGPYCGWQFTGVQFNHETQEYKEVATQFLSTASCPGLEDCKLTDVVLLDDFTHLHALRVNVTVVGEPKNWWMDDLKLEWANGSCDARLCRSMHR